ncbi:glycosyltransferase, partial [Parabacteroides sp. AM18-12LB]
KIYFGEMTFTNGSGFEEISPIEADLMLGDLWKIKELDF